MSDPAKVIKKPEYPCVFCRKNEATRLCDFIIDYQWTTMKDEQGRMIGGYPVTCNNQICTECSTRIPGFDFCPSCNKLREMIKHHRDQRIRPGNYIIETIFKLDRERREKANK